MAYGTDLKGAARRHLEAARDLMGTNREDVAGYLFGIAAECAVKEMARHVPSIRSDDIFYAHFPELRTLLRDQAKGRRAPPLLRLIEQNDFMNEWHVKMRYASANDVREKPIASWAEQAGRAVSAIDGVTA